MTLTLANAQTWSKLDGPYAYINAIFLPDNSGTIFVASDIVPSDFQQDNILFPNFGVGQNGFKISTNKGQTFSDDILKDYSVFSFYAYPNNPSTILSSIRQFNEGGIVLSTDQGSTWDLSHIHCLSSSQIVNITSSQSDASKLYAAEVNTSKGYKFSLDTFNTCETDEQFVIQARDIAVSPQNPDLVFIAGSKSLKQVYRSRDRGVTWEGNLSGLENKRILSLMPSMYDEAVIIAGVDSLDFNRNSHGKGIYISLDTGNTWSLAGASGKRVFDLAQHPTNPKYMAAACDSGSVFISGSYGYGWEEHAQGIPFDASVRRVAITGWSDNEGAVVLAGTFGQGLFISSSIITTVEGQIASNSLKIISIAPQPFFESVSINILNVSEGSLNARLYDCLGSLLIEREVNTYGGIAPLTLDGRNLPHGIYLLVVSTPPGAAL